MGWVWFIKWGWDGREGRGVKAEVSRCIIGGGGASVVFFTEGKCCQTVNGSKKYLRKNQELTFIERTNMHTMPNL